MYDTTYHRPSSVKEAMSLKNDAANGNFISGGQTLLPTMKLRLAAPSDLIDLCHITELHGIQIDADRITIGATTTHAEVAASDELRVVCRGICELASLIGDPHVRQMGTIGGSLANNDPAADYPAAMLALDATINTNVRSIACDSFFTGLFQTSLDDDEIITSVTFDVPSRSAYAKFVNPASRFALTGVFVGANVDGAPRVAVTGAGANGVYRHSAMESALGSNWTATAIDSCSVDEQALLSDIHASAGYRANLVKVMAKRAVAASGEH